MPATEKRRRAASVARKMPPWRFAARQLQHLPIPSLKTRAGAHTVRRTVCVAVSLVGSPQGRAACRILSTCACCRAARLYPSAVQPAVSARRAAGVDVSDAKASVERAARGTGSPFAAAGIFRPRRASAGWLPSDRGDRVPAVKRPHSGRGRQPHRQRALTFL